MSNSIFFGIEVILGSLIGFFVSLLGWQVNLVSIHRGLSHGRRSAFFTGMSAALGDVCVMAVIFSGAVSFVDRKDWPGWMKWVGVAVLVLIALKILFSKPKSQTAFGLSQTDQSEVSRGNLIGFLVVITNPGVYLLWAGVWGFLLARFPELGDWSSFLLFMASFLSGAALWFLILSWFFLGHIQQWQESRLRILSRIIAVVMLIAAAALAFSKV